MFTQLRELRMTMDSGKKSDYPHCQINEGLSEYLKRDSATSRIR